MAVELIIEKQKDTEKRRDREYEKKAEARGEQMKKINKKIVGLSRKSRKLGKQAKKEKAKGNHEKAQQKFEKAKEAGKKARDLAAKEAGNFYPAGSEKYPSITDALKAAQTKKGRTDIAKRTMPRMTENWMSIADRKKAFMEEMGGCCGGGGDAGGMAGGEIPNSVGVDGYTSAAPAKGPRAGFDKILDMRRKRRKGSK